MLHSVKSNHCCGLQILWLHFIMQHVLTVYLPRKLLGGTYLLKVTTWIKGIVHLKILKNVGSQTIDGPH